MTDRDDYQARLTQDQSEQAAAMAARPAQTRIDAALGDARELAGFFVQTGLNGPAVRDALNALYPIEPAVLPVETPQVQKEPTEHAKTAVSRPTLPRRNRAR